MKIATKLLPILLLATPIFAYAGGVPKKDAEVLVNVNTAGRWELQHDLNDVSKGLAQNIVNYRNKHGDFTNKSQLLKVPDFNREDLMLNRGFLTVSGKSGSAA